MEGLSFDDDKIRPPQPVDPAYKPGDKRKEPPPRKINERPKQTETDEERERKRRDLLEEIQKNPKYDRHGRIE